MQMESAEKIRKQIVAMAGSYTVSEAAVLLRVTPTSLYRWEKWGWIKPGPRDAVGRRYYREQDLERIRAAVLKVKQRNKGRRS